MKTITPPIKGTITGVLMVVSILLLYYSNLPAESIFQNIRYLFYAAGIIWAMASYTRTASYTGKFSELFGQGFRCFIVVVLIMVAFTAIFSMLHPEFAEESAKYHREELVKLGNKTPNEIDELVNKAKNQYTTGVVYFTIFGYLIFGAIITAAGSAVLIMRKK